MATGKIQIINSALLLAGCDTITSLNQENSRNARVANTVYDKVRQGLLRMHPWNFAVKRVSLARLVETPAFGYSYYYQLPSDCVRVVREANPNVVYKVEGRKILSNQAEVNIIYVADIDDVSMMDRLFIEALTFRLAAQFAAIIKIDPGAAGNLDAKAEMIERKARQVDGQEETAEMLISNLWTDGENG